MIDLHWRLILPVEASCNTMPWSGSKTKINLAHGQLGEPLWPAGLVGSISHAGGLRAQAIAPSRQIAALGIDMERRETLAPADWSRMLAPSEIDELLSRPAPQRGLAALEIWCLKEALFKALRGLIPLDELCLCRGAEHWQPAAPLREHLCRNGLTPERLVMRSISLDGWQLAAVWQYHDAPFRHTDDDKHHATVFA